MISDKTKAILLVHYAGYLVDVPELKEKLRRKINRKIKIIEDCAHALGATIDGRMVGTFGDYGIFSFQAIKHMTTIDGGFLVIKDTSQTKLAKNAMVWHGKGSGKEHLLT